MKRIVVALGGNAILTDDPSAQAQQLALEHTAEYLVKLMQRPDVQLVITHGNGPQVGNLLLQQLAGSSDKNPAMPLDTVGAMTQGEIGLWLANALNKAASEHQVDADIATILTRTVVDQNDPAFKEPTKPIGPFYNSAETVGIQAEHPDWQLVEDAGRGFRRVVPSPKPLRMMEATTIKKLAEDNITLIVSGGGGVPVVADNGSLNGVEAVIDKDFSAAKLAELVEADELVILTAVKYVAINYQTESQQELHQVTVSEMTSYLNDGQFAAGSMKPKVEAALSYVNVTGKPAVITSLANIDQYIKNNDGTIIIPD